MALAIPSHSSNVVLQFQTVFDVFSNRPAPAILDISFKGSSFRTGLGQPSKTSRYAPWLGGTLGLAGSRFRSVRAWLEPSSIAGYTLWSLRALLFLTGFVRPTFPTCVLQVETLAAALGVPEALTFEASCGVWAADSEPAAGPDNPNEAHLGGFGGSGYANLCHLLSVL